MFGSVMQRLGSGRLGRLTVWNYNSPENKASEPDLGKTEDDVTDWGEQARASYSNGNYDAAHDLGNRVEKRALDIPYCSNENEDEKVLSGHFLALQTEVPRRWYHRRSEVEQSQKHKGTQDSCNADVEGKIEVKRRGISNADQL